MTPEQISLIKTSFETVSRDMRAAGAELYRRLFEIDPKLKDLFQGDIDAQGKALFGMMDLVVSSLEIQEQLVPIIYEMGRRHAGYGVNEEDYQAFGVALLDTLKALLGSEFTPEVREAWCAAYDFVAEIMQTAHGDVREGRTLSYRGLRGAREEWDEEQ